MSKNSNVNTNQTKKTGGNRLIKVILWIVGILLALVLAFFIFITVAEYRPGDIDAVDIVHGGEIVTEPMANEQSRTLSAGDSISVLSWNTGYASLPDHVDFFMDGGEMVHTCTPEENQENIDAMVNEIKQIAPDFLVLQEVDKNSARTAGANQLPFYANALPDSYYSFAPNFKALFVPFPWPPIGKVDSGIQTVSSCAPVSAERYALPNPFSWPVRTVNLKRCLLVTKYPIAGGDRNLVLINLHLEAYDDGEGKEAQTKMLCDIMNSFAEAGDYVIAGGDFNQVFSNADTSAYTINEGEWQAGSIDVTSHEDTLTWLMDSEVRSCRSLSKPLAGANPETFQYYLIDGFIISKNLTVEEFHGIDLGFANSDHNPLYLKVKLN